MTCACDGVVSMGIRCARALVISLVKCDIAVTLGDEIRISIGL